MPPPYDAVVCRGDEVMGPVRLPEINPAGFIQQFRKTYCGMGITVQPLDRMPLKQAAEKTRE